LRRQDTGEAMLAEIPRTVLQELALKSGETVFVKPLS
jgi:hypothetical protein